MIENKKRSMNIHLLTVLILITIFLIIPIISASNQDSDLNISVDLHSSSVIRTGNIFPASITIRNLNENEILNIKKVTILNDDKKIIKEEGIDKKLRPLKKTFSREKEIRNYLQKPEFCEFPELIEEQPEYQEYLDLYSKIKNETFQKSFRLDIRDFDENPEVGEIINISIDIEFKIGNEKFVVHRERGILFSEPLPKPPHNSPGWYVGDQHVHSHYGRHPTEPDIDLLEDMVDAAKASELDWLIFTDHSFAFSEASEWEDGRDACDLESTSSFKCLYGQEMSIGDPGGLLCDSWFNGHYLAHPYTDDDLGYIDGGCGVFPYCICRDEQPVINDINNAGGMGFIAHPHILFFDWDDWSVTGFTGLEIINGAWNGADATTVNNPGGDDDSWREFLQSETNPDNGFVVGIANSDAHHTEDLNQTFTYCHLDSLTTSNIRNALKDGHCVASTGPFVEFTLDGEIIGESVDVPSGTNTLDISASSNGEFGDLQWLYIYVDEQLEDYISLSGTSYSDSVDISLDTTDNYIRLEVYTDTGRRAYTNPIWVDVTSCSCGSWSAGSCGGGSCNSEQKQWTRSCTPSACASETKCVYDSDCEEEGPGPTECEEAGYEFCLELEYEDCDVSVALNLYDNVNTIQWGAVNDAWDPYVIDEYTIGWKGVDTEKMYYAVEDPGTDGTKDCHYGGCDTGELVDEVDTRVTVTAPGTAYQDIVLGYDDTTEWACWVWFIAFYPYYENNPYIYVLNCFDDGDCSSSKYCDKSSTWSNWDCVNDKSNGQSCIRDAQCSSGYCDDDGVGLSDDDHCFAPYNTYFDGQETNYCEYSTGSGHLNCDERQVGDDLNLCIGTSYYEEECSSTCAYQDITSVFECTDAGCSCSESLCDGLTTGSSITTCTAGETYFADKCTSTAGGEDRGDNICRNSTFASGCTADPECGDIVAGTENCNATCSFAPPDTHKFYIKNSTGSAVAWLGDEGNIVLKGTCTASSNCTTPQDSFIIANSTDNTVAYIDNGGNLCLEIGDCSDQSANCNAPQDAFIIRNSTNNNVIYIDKYGDLCLIGRLYENSEP